MKVIRENNIKNSMKEFPHELLHPESSGAYTALL